MATFRVGQRVRITDSGSGWYGNGKAGVIAYIGPIEPADGFRFLGKAPNCEVVLDIGESAFTHTDWLEPLTDDRNQVIPWEKCCVGPDGVWREGVAA